LAPRKRTTWRRHWRQTLASIPGVEIQQPPEANILFCRLRMPLIRGLLDMGFGFYHDRWEPGIIRLVTSFSTTAEDVADFVRAASAIARSPPSPSFGD
jgi:threonine aldolase